MGNALGARDSRVRRARLQGLALLAAALAVGGAVAYGLLAAGGALTAGREGRQEPMALSQPRTGLVPTNENRGQVLFGRYCDSCHPAGRESLGPSLRSAQAKRRYDTEAELVDLVRKGGFDMPAYPPEFLPDTELAEIARYLLRLPEEGP